MDPEFMKVRTKQFALAIIKLTDGFPTGRVASVIANQLIRSGTSVGANYRAACRGKSRPDFIAKMEIAIEEVDETLYWLELLLETGLIPVERITPLMNEANELLSILIASVKTAKSHLPQRK